MKIIIYGFLILFLAACKITKQNEEPNLKESPEYFLVKADSVSAANYNWRKFFGDSNLCVLLQEAVDNNLDVLMAMQKIEMLRSKVVASTGAVLPQVNGATSLAQRKYGLYTMDGAGNISTEITPGKIVPIHLPDYYLGLQTSWEIDVWSKLRNKKRSAIARYMSTVEGRNLVLTEIIEKTAMAYYNLIGLDIELEIIRETIKLQDDALQIVKIQKESGVANELAVKQFQAQLLNSKGLEVEIQQKIIETENLINFLCARYPKQIVRDKTLFAAEMPNAIASGIPSQLLKNRPDIRKAEYEMLAARADVKAARAAFYPSFTINGGLGFQAFKPEFIFSTPSSIAYSLLGNITAPLINRSAIKAEFNSANAKQLSSLYAYQKVVINAYVEVYNEITRIENLEKIHSFKQEQVKVLTEAIETSSELFKTGRATYIEVLTTQKNALSARLELVNARKRQYYAVTNIYKALGGGWK